MRALRILPPGAGPALDPADTTPEVPAAPTGSAKIRETACEGYRRAIAAHQEAAPPRRVDQGIAEAVERQNRAMRELSRPTPGRRKGWCEGPTEPGNVFVMFFQTPIYE